MPEIKEKFDMIEEKIKKLTDLLKERTKLNKSAGDVFFDQKKRLEKYLSDIMVVFDFNFKLNDRVRLRINNDYIRFSYDCDEKEKREIEKIGYYNAMIQKISDGVDAKEIDDTIKQLAAENEEIKKSV